MTRAERTAADFTRAFVWTVFIICCAVFAGVLAMAAMAVAL